MLTTYRLKTDEINENFIDSIKKLFENKEIEILIYDVDETDYLLKSIANKNHLLNAVQNVANNQNLVEVKLENFNA